MMECCGPKSSAELARTYLHGVVPDDLRSEVLGSEEDAHSFQEGHPGK